VSRFFKETVGAAMIEFTLILPLLLAVALGTVDVTFMLYDWALANKAAYRGARVAVVVDPVAMNVTNLDYDDHPLHIGDLCFVVDTGAPNADFNCPAVSTKCTSTECSPDTWGYNSGNFDVIVGEMRDIFPRLTDDNVEIEYKRNGLGFYGRPDGLPMDVTVRIRCMRAQFFFMGAWASWVYDDLPDNCPDEDNVAGPPLPAFSTTLQSEGMGAS
jgi:hypothetical protein